MVAYVVEPICAVVPIAASTPWCITVTAAPSTVDALHGPFAEARIAPSVWQPRRFVWRSAESVVGLLKMKVIHRKRP